MYVSGVCGMSMGTDASRMSIVFGCRRCSTQNRISALHARIGAYYTEAITEIRLRQQSNHVASFSPLHAQSSFRSSFEKTPRHRLDFQEKENHRDVHCTTEQISILLSFGSFSGVSVVLNLLLPLA